MEGTYKKYALLGTAILIIIALGTTNIWDITFQQTLNIDYENAESTGGWPQAEEELGLAWPLISKSWDHNAVRAGNPVHPLAEYGNPCWEETVSEERLRAAYKHNGFLDTSQPRVIRKSFKNTV